jgi:murein L,D-transpeptidase YcbB/YkuD
MNGRSFYLGWLLLLLAFIFSSCDHEKKSIIPPQKMDAAVQLQISLFFDSLQQKQLNDTTFLFAPALIKQFYQSTAYAPIWSTTRTWKAAADSLFLFVNNCYDEGLLPSDYHQQQLAAIKLELDQDSVHTSTPLRWALVDILMTDALVHIFQDVKQGRLQHDSLDWVNKPDKAATFFVPLLKVFIANPELHQMLGMLEPTHKHYHALKKALLPFAKSMNKKSYSYLRYPYKDSAAFVKRLVQRLSEDSILPNATQVIDTSVLADLITRYQKANQIKITGKIAASLVNDLNNTDLEKFLRVAITLDKYKNIADSFPEKYILVNLPAYQLWVWDHDSIALSSRVIIGKSRTPTPHITSAISNLVIYPTWTVPNSIVIGELLPGLKKDSGYLAKKGLGLYNYNGEPITAYGIDWTKYSKNIPYLVRQSSGDNNALGVIKFNFSNPYDVYLHDTNQRYLFKNKNRSLSHGCVRVEQWQKLAFYIARNDSMYNNKLDQYSYNTDSLLQWLGQKTYRTVYVKKRLPLYIMYFSVAFQNGELLFYDDVYGEDKALREKYFAIK